MGGSLQTNNPTVVAAFESALVHQGLVVLVILALLSVAWNLLRREQLRQAVAAGGGQVAALAGEAGVSEPPALRLLRISFGCIWVLDGILQAQVSMPLGMISGVVQPAAAGSPSWVLHLVNFGGTIWDNILFRPPRPRCGSSSASASGCLSLHAGTGCDLPAAASAAWGLVVWVFGEAFGSIFVPGLTWLFGAPGWSRLLCHRRRPLALPERYWSRPQLGRAILASMGLFFVGMAVLQAWPDGLLAGSAQSARGRRVAHRHGAVHGANPQPGFVSSWVASFAAFDRPAVGPSTCSSSSRSRRSA